MSAKEQEEKSEKKKRNDTGKKQKEQKNVIDSNVNMFIQKKGRRYSRYGIHHSWG